MKVVFQKGSVFSSPPKSVSGVDYTVIYSDTGVICCILKTLDQHTVISIDARDPIFEETIATLGLEKNQTPVAELSL